MMFDERPPPILRGDLFTLLDPDGSGREGTLVAEHLHAIDEIADAIGLAADELRQGAVFVGERRFEK